MQIIISEYMKKGGHTCFTADDGIDALMFLKNQPMDLLILDIMMPHLDGFSVCKLAREMGNMPIIMLTAKSRRLYDKAVQPQGLIGKGKCFIAPKRANLRRRALCR